MHLSYLQNYCRGLTLIPTPIPKRVRVTWPYPRFQDSQPQSGDMAYSDLRRINFVTFDSNSITWVYSDVLKKKMKQSADQVNFAIVLDISHLYNTCLSRYIICGKVKYWSLNYRLLHLVHKVNSFLKPLFPLNYLNLTCFFTLNSFTDSHEKFDCIDQDIDHAITN